MDVCGLSKARPILCNDSPAFQRRHTSVRCATESSTYFPCGIDTTSAGRFISGGVASTYWMHRVYGACQDMARRIEELANAILPSQAERTSQKRRQRKWLAIMM